ncbi:Clavaminate synthase-like protein [Microthyrium microscopicum]|uniref:Clavaminate synthase-like protein n=1 Tax=Microthyrium microscopicum TaxID=703497 RepID=A0A6A6UES5_9PEZI|nr:Clavaminate synthase-like protein [Microthyrium microscopicum]
MTSAAVEQDNLFIPLIDFAPFRGGSAADKKAVANDIVNGFRNAGFIYLKNHGISPAAVASVFGQSAKFFQLPQDQKDKLAWYSAEANRGYTAHGREKVSMADVEDVDALRESNPDLKESLEIGRDDEPQFPNMWPPQEGESQWPTEFRKETMGFFEQCKEMHRLVMSSIAVGLGIGETWFDGFTSDGDNTLRLLHYPAVSREVFEKNVGQVRAGEHTDYGSMTLLFQDARGGLQVESPNGNFVDATPIPDTIVVNAGDLMARWSNDYIKSTKHRVVEPPNKTSEYPARYSIAYFCNPNFTSKIEAIPGTVAEGVQKYEPIISGEYLVQRLTATY